MPHGHLGELTGVIVAHCSGRSRDLFGIAIPQQVAESKRIDIIPTRIVSTLTRHGSGEQDGCR